jgi:hypothetical protein
MKGLAALSLIALASALPQDIGEGSPKPIGKTMAKTISGLRGKDGKLHGGVGPESRSEITAGSGCGDITFIFARASMEPGNMVCRDSPSKEILTSYREDPWARSSATA